MTFIPDVSVALTKGGRNGDGSEETFVADTLTSGSHPASNMPGRRREDDTNLVAFALRSQERNTSQGNGNYVTANTLKGQAGKGGSGIGPEHNFAVAAAGVRRLTPTECERLQGFPDGWTAIPGAPDSRRYAAMGDAVTVPVSRWIGERLAMYAGEMPTIAKAVAP
jgi:DNA (cytosine-5)-methyltransferase 1